MASEQQTVRGVGQNIFHLAFFISHFPFDPRAIFALVGVDVGSTAVRTASYAEAGNIFDGK